MQPDFGAGLSVISTESCGSLLILPEGGQKTNHMQVLKFQKYAVDCVNSWLNHVNDADGYFAREVEGLYLVTGCDKARAWGIASFYDANSKEIVLEFVPKLSEHSGQLPEYKFSKSNYASVSADSDSEFQNQSGCLFLRGYKITARKFPQSIFTIGTKITSISNLDAGELFPRLAVAGSLQTGASAIFSSLAEIFNDSWLDSSWFIGRKKSRYQVCLLCDST